MKSINYTNWETLFTWLEIKQEFFLEALQSDLQLSLNLFVLTKSIFSELTFKPFEGWWYCMTVSNCVNVSNESNA